MARDTDKLEGQRAAIREHIAKYEFYHADHDKQFALKTIRNAQKRIRDIIWDHAHWPASWEDTWAPPGGWSPE